MRQSDVLFSNILTKIGNGERLNKDERKLLESRFRTREWCDTNVKNATRLFHKNHDVDNYNRAVVVPELHSIAVDSYTGHRDQTELVNARTHTHKKRVTETANMPYDLILTLNYPYMITTNICVEDGLVNGAIGLLKHVELKPQETNSTSQASNDSNIHCLWLEFTENTLIGRQTRSKIRPKVLTTHFRDLISHGRRSTGREQRSLLTN